MLTFLAALLLPLVAAAADAKQPHLVLMVLDDLGWVPRLGHQLPDPATRQPGRRRGDPGQVLRPASLLTDPVGSHDGKVPVQDRPPAHHHAGAWDVRGHPQRHLDYRGGAQGRGLRDARHREVAPRAEELGRHAPRARLRFVGGLPERSNRKGATAAPTPPNPRDLRPRP